MVPFQSSSAVSYSPSIVTDNSSEENAANSNEHLICPKCSQSTVRAGEKDEIVTYLPLIRLPGCRYALFVSRVHHYASAKLCAAEAIMFSLYRVVPLSRCMSCADTGISFASHETEGISMKFGESNLHHQQIS